MKEVRYQDSRLDNIMRFWREIPVKPDRPLTISLLKDDMSHVQSELDRLLAVEAACKRLAYIVRKSVNSGPLSRDPTQEAEAWRQLRIALGEGYDERGNLVPVSP